jgi:hypothetical protein
LLGVAAKLRRVGPNLDLAPLVEPARALAWLFGRLGSDRGAALFEVTGVRDGVQVRDRVAVIADRDGGRIPILPAAIAIEDLLGRRSPEPGLNTPGTWFDGDRLLEGAWSRGLRVVRSSTVCEPA